MPEELIKARSIDALSRLGSRVFFGAAETDLINEIANGSMTPEQAIAALNEMLAPLLAGQDADNATLARQLAFGWLANKAAGYIETSYVTFIANDGKKERAARELGMSRATMRRALMPWVAPNFIANSSFSSARSILFS